MIFGILFLLLPIVEIALFIRVVNEIGFFSAVFLCLAMAIVGGALVRRQGLNTLAAIQAALDRGEMPVDRMFDGMCLFVAGALFLLPGFFSDFLALLLLLPPTRAVLRRHVAQYMTVTDGAMNGGVQPPDSEILDAEFTRVEDEDENDRLLLP
ncbi:MAG TPA: FxsA family protein [Micavibrio sp.]|jgi:UPF0716 protein FxsA